MTTETELENISTHTVLHLNARHRCNEDMRRSLNDCHDSSNVLYKKSLHFFWNTLGNDMPLYENRTNLMNTPRKPIIYFERQCQQEKNPHDIQTKMMVQSLLNAYLRSILQERLGACFPYPLSWSRNDCYFSGQHFIHWSNGRRMLTFEVFIVHWQAFNS